jgi:hypothetical protein
MAATKRLSPVATQETLDKLAGDVSMPIPDMGQARLLAGIFNVLGLGFIILGAIALYFGLQPVSVQTSPSNTTNLLSEMGEMFGGSSRAALVMASIVGIVGGASYMLIGATVNMIADIRVEMAHNRRLLAAMLETTLRPRTLSITPAPAPTAPVSHFAPTQTLPSKPPPEPAASELAPAEPEAKPEPSAQESPDLELGPDTEPEPDPEPKLKRLTHNP